ncbi:Dolichyl-diphosphooligosaccharide-protein glycosyltransferase subunit dad1 [Blyttiomyces sp. JEL0837]|nr:Dolichyl-diphosphooligosaccharide-protein glycosyltransferase subunit dad1 [Blyttiomyces sp. JEL0837]
MAPKKDAKATTPATSSVDTTTTTSAPSSSPVKKPSTSSLSSSSKSSESFLAQQTNVLSRLFSEYNKTTPQLLKIIDAYLAFVMMTGVIQFIYVVIAGTFPYNSFLSGFIASVGAFVLAANLRIQLNPSNDFNGLSPEAAYAEFAFCSVVLYGFVVNFLG